MKSATIAGILAVCLFLSGCPKSKDPYTASMQASLSVSDAVAQAIPIVQQLQTSNGISLDEAKTVYGYLNTATTGNRAFRATATSLHAAGNNNPAAYIAAADAFVKSVNSASALTSIRIVNPASQNKVMLYLNIVDAALTGIQTVIQNNTTTPAPVTIPATGGMAWTPTLSPIWLS